MHLTANRGPIESMGDWFRLAPPQKRERQWKDGRSAKELAKAWVGAGAARVPAELDALFKSRPATESLVLECGTPEVVTKLDDYRGGKRNHDLVLIGQAGGVRTLVAVEAKADESFGPVIERYVDQKKGTSSRIPDRIEHLFRALFGRPLDAEVGSLRYQLLHGVAGTLIEAHNRGAAQAVFVVHEFLSAATNDEKVDQNAKDLDRFVRALSGGAVDGLRDGCLVGPFQVSGGEFVLEPPPLYVGKVTTWLDRPAA